MIEILPAINVPDGYWTGIWAKFVKDGTAETVFCDGEIADAEAFASMMNYVFVHPHIILYNGALAAVVWLIIGTVSAFLDARYGEETTVKK